MKENSNQDFVAFNVYKAKVISKLNKIIEEEFIYSVDNIVDMLSIQRIYIQENICPKLNNFNLDRGFKAYIKACMGSRRYFRELSQYVDMNRMTFKEFESNNQDLVDLIKRSGLNTYKLSRRILISKKQLRTLLPSIFSVEYVEKYYAGPDKSKITVIDYNSLTEGDIDCILEYGVVNQAYLKEFYGVKTELQVYRRLEKDNLYVMRKYVVETEHEKKRGLTRYLVNKDNTTEGHIELGMKLYGDDFNYL